MKNNGSILTELEECIFKVREKGVLLEDEDLLSTAKDLVQVKQEVVNLINCVQDTLKEIRSSRDNFVSTQITAIEDLDKGHLGL